jgi:hypothetical protein
LGTLPFSVCGFLLKHPSVVFFGRSREKMVRADAASMKTNVSASASEVVVVAHVVNVVVRRQGAKGYPVA